MSFNYIFPSFKCLQDFFYKFTLFCWNLIWVFFRNIKYPLIPFNTWGHVLDYICNSRFLDFFLSLHSFSLFLTILKTLHFILERNPLVFVLSVFHQHFIISFSVLIWPIYLFIYLDSSCYIFPVFLWF